MLKMTFERMPFASASEEKLNSEDIVDKSDGILLYKPPAMGFQRPITLPPPQHLCDACCHTAQRQHTSSQSVSCRVCEATSRRLLAAAAADDGDDDEAEPPKKGWVSAAAETLKP